MSPILDPRLGDAEDDASSTKSRKLSSIAGSMLAEVSLPKLLVAWLMLIGVPGIVLGMAPLLASAWLSTVSDRLYAISGLGSLVGIAGIFILSWYGIRPAFRFIERSFWALHALAVQPVYALFRESLSQVAEAFLDEDAGERERSQRRVAMATLAGVLSSILARNAVGGHLGDIRVA